MSESRHRVAAIDIGTVTTRLLIADVSPAGVEEVVRRTDITHLGEGLMGTGALSETAMGRVEAAIARYAVELEEHGVETARAIATSAARDASNAAEFTRMLGEYGLAPDVVPGRIEARLAFTGAVFGRSGEDLLVNDIGGGSTEVVLGCVARDGVAVIESADSIDVGSRRVTELHLPSDPPAADEITTARRWVSDHFGRLAEQLHGRSPHSISLAGTATTLSAIDQGLAVYDPSRVHDSVLGIDRIHEITEMLAALPLAKRVGVLGLDPGRAPVIVAGGLILGVLLEVTGSDSTVVSEHDILYGIALDLAARADAGFESE